MKKNQEYRRPRHPKFHSLEHCGATGKVRYKDHRMATEFLHHFKNIAAESIAEKGSTTHHEKRSYKCKACQGWHLTSWEQEYAKYELAA
jgi:spore maturation protein CgeB